MRRIIEISDMDHFRRAAQFSDEHIKNPCHGLAALIMRLVAGDYGAADRLLLFPDFVRHSFGFEFARGAERVMNGGIILHAETLSMELCAPPGQHYSVHT